MANFDPYGVPLEKIGINPSELGYTGEQTDPNGLQYLRARYMNPATGTFLSRDPVEGTMGRIASMNGYGYAEGNPAVYSDPSGQCVGPLMLICLPALIGGLAAINEWRGQVYANQMKGMSFWGASYHSHLDTANIVRSGAHAAAVVGVGEIGFAGAMGAAGWVGSSVLGMTQASAWATAYGVGSIGVAGAVSGQFVRGTNNLFSGKDFGHNLGRWQDVLLDGFFAIGSTWFIGSLANGITGGNRNYFTDFLAKAPPPADPGASLRKRRAWFADEEGYGKWLTGRPKKSFEPGIYEFTDLTDSQGRTYIGQSMDLRRRLRDHFIDGRITDYSQVRYMKFEFVGDESTAFWLDAAERIRMYQISQGNISNLANKDIWPLGNRAGTILDLPLPQHWPKSLEIPNDPLFFNLRD